MLATTPRRTPPTRGASLEPPAIPAVERYHPSRRATTAARLQRGELVRVRAGVYGPPVLPSSPALERRDHVLLHVAAVRERLTTTYCFSHETAALLWGCWTWRLDDAVHLTQPRPPSIERAVEPGTRRHWTTLPGRDRCEVGGVPVTSLERTLVDCARTLEPASAVVVADAALRKGADPRLVQHLLDGAAGGRGVIRARSVIAFADGASESPGESLTRWFAADAGLPVPEHCITVPTALGVKDVDLGWPELKIGIEFDGAVKYSGGAYGDPTTRLFDEKRRHDALVEAGWLLIRVTWDDLLRPERLVARLRAAFARRRRQLAA